MSEKFHPEFFIEDSTDGFVSEEEESAVNPTGTEKPIVGMPSPTISPSNEESDIGTPPPIIRSPTNEEPTIGTLCLPTIRSPSNEEPTIETPPSPTVRSPSNEEPTIETPPSPTVRSPSNEEPTIGTPLSLTIRSISTVPPPFPEQMSDHSEDHIPLNMRKRAVRPDQWKQNQTKIAYNSGLAHTTVRNKPKEARSMRPPCEVQCRKCKQRLSEDQRQEIFKGFWSIKNHELHWQYILRHVRVISPKKKKVGTKNKATTRNYFLRLGKKEYPVCKTMFLNTLGICDSWVESAVRKTLTSGNVAADGRGRHSNRPRRLSCEKVKNIKEHIDMFKRVPSHYTRKRSKRQYLDPSLSIRAMHRLYVTWAKEKELPQDLVASEGQYRFIFNTQYNLGFHQPKNDQCFTCNKYKAASKTDKEQMKPTMVRHLLNKQQSKKLVEEYTKEAESSERLCVCSFDLQKVLPCPKSKTSVFFYRNKASILNFTIFIHKGNRGFCFVWDETTAKRGANEIASFLYEFIKMMRLQGFEEFRFVSDSCSGQNRNRFVFGMYAKVAQELNVKIRHVFLEPGHTQMEVDSIHARIEKSTAKTEIFSKSEWMEAIEKAKVMGQPYKVHEVTQNQIFDFKELVSKQRWDYTDDRKPIKWGSVKVVEVDGAKEEVRFKYSYHGATHVTNLKKKGRSVNLKTYKLQAAYSGKIPLKAKKARDLRYLCEKGAIPARYHHEYSAYLGFLVGAARNTEWTPVEDVAAIACADEEDLLEEENDVQECLPEEGQDLLAYLRDDDDVPEDLSVAENLSTSAEEEGRILLDCLEKEKEHLSGAEELSEAKDLSGAEGDLSGAEDDF